MKKQKLKGVQLISGALAVSLVVLGGCADNSMNADLTKNNPVAESSTGDCTLLKTTMRTALEARVKGVQDTMLKIENAISTNKGEKTLPALFTQRLDTIKAYPALVQTQLGILDKAPTQDDVLKVASLIDNILDTATTAQNDVVNQLNKDFGITISVDGDVSSTPGSTLAKSLADLDVEIATLRGDASLSAEAQLALAQLAAQIDVAQHIITNNQGLHLDANASLDGQSDVQLALKEVQDRLLDVKAKVSASLGDEAAAKLLLNTDLSSVPALKKAAPVPEENHVNLNANATVKIPAVQKAIPKPVVVPHAEIKVDSNVKTVAPTPATTPVKPGTSLSAPVIPSDVKATVNATVDTTVNAATQNTPPVPSAEVNTNAVINTTVDAAVDVESHATKTLNGLLK